MGGRSDGQTDRRRALGRSALPHAALLLLIAYGAGQPHEAAAQVFRDLRGTVRSITDSSALAGVRVTAVGERIPAVSAPSAISGADGSFTLARIPLSGVRLALARSGIARDTVPVPDGVGTFTAYVLVVPVALPPVVISAMERPIARERFETVAQPSTVSLAAADIRRAPGVLQADVVRVVHVLNGPMEVPGGDRIAQCLDPQGAAFAVHQLKP